MSMPDMPSSGVWSNTNNIALWWPKSSYTGLPAVWGKYQNNRTQDEKGPGSPVILHPLYNSTSFI